METTTALLRIAANVSAASAVLVVRIGDAAPVAAWGCDAGAATALVRVFAGHGTAATSGAETVTVRLGDGSAAALVLVGAKPLTTQARAIVQALADEIAASVERATAPPGALGRVRRIPVPYASISWAAAMPVSRAKLGT